MTLPSPATTTEVYLAAIHDELRALRVDLAGGGQVQDPPAAGPVPVDGMGEQPPPTKRTRQRPR